MWPSARSGFQFFVFQDEVGDIEILFIMVVVEYSLLILNLVSNLNIACVYWFI